ncbi:Activin_recp domain-containing protein [Caenorhabditis elegans]|uniref:Activin_recp domain-containing protein n=1 Tax=Caenorhabditis elegans TaxID=6239 RepID=G4RV56_CAEEL|nr:Activin_recp domain-containing protein [Caenorhabditis elegans]CCD62850.1 Activin_recp domain-containing protein [Caenorhabditis elegans]|eukprot:NP_001254119.1 Uncharacterized protein CELE_C04A2.15 [Caenorhabditis elegans]
MRYLSIICIFCVLVEYIFCYDCYKFSKSEFATIKSCAYGCEYEYKVKDGLNQKESGGCAQESAPKGCRQRGSKTACICSDNYCNKLGYDMRDSSEES